MKRLLALIMAMALILCFAACNDEKAENKDGAKTTVEEEAGTGTEVPEVEEKELSAEEVSEKSLAAMKDAKTVKGTMEAVMNISAAGQGMDMTISADMEEDVENRIAHMKMDINAMGQNVETEMYIEYSDTTATMYINNMGTWAKQEVDVSALSSELGMGMEGIEGTVAYIENLADYSMEKNGDTYVVEGKPDDSQFEKIMSSVMKSTLGSDEIPEAMVEKLIESMKDIKVTAHIDAETFLVTGFDMDMSDMIVSMFDALSEYTGQEIKLDNAKYTAKVKYSDYNEPVNIEIPEEAKAA